MQFHADLELLAIFATKKIVLMGEDVIIIVDRTHGKGSRKKKMNHNLLNQFKSSGFIVNFMFVKITFL